MISAPAELRGLPSLVEELLEAVDGLAPASVRHDLEQAGRRLAEERLNLVVLGEFKRGKSTLVNALLGADVVQTGVLPLTAAVTALRYGESERVIVDFEDGGRYAARLGVIPEFTTEAGNPDNRRGVRLVTIELPNALLASGLQLVDTPGIGSVFAHNTATALGFLGQVDTGLFTLAADQPLSSTEEELIREACERLPRLIFALNKVDRHDAAEREQVTEFVRERLREMLGAEPDLYALSARSGEGVESLRRRLRRLATEERAGIVTRSVHSLAAGFAAEALQAIRFEARAVELPLTALEGRLDDFRQRAAQLEQTREEAAELLVQGAKRLVRERVDEPLLSLARREGDECAEALLGFAAEQGSLSSGKLAQKLEAWSHSAIKVRFAELAADYERSLAKELGSLHERYAERVDRIMSELDDAAAEAFGERMGRLVQPVSLRRPSHFSFKLQDVEREMLDQLASAAVASVPGAVGRRLVLRQAEERLRILLDRHAGRLRSDLADRIEESVRDYARELAGAVSEVVAAVEAAVERAAREQRSGRLQVSKRLEKLRQVGERVDGLARALAALPAEGAPQGSVVGPSLTRGG